MNHFLKGAAVAAVVTIINLIIHVFCNTHGITLDPVMSGPVAVVCALLLYHGLIRKEKK